ncbi:PD40 domain-containing protein [bacterium]|nr:PD40 domain-containing protein [bacterium]
MVKQVFTTTCLVILICLVACQKNGLEPEDIVRKEETSIPWDLLSGKIAYRGGDIESCVIIIDADQKAMRLLKSSDHYTYHELAWKPDGTQITYSKFDYDDSLYRLYHLDVQSGRSQQVYAPDAHNNYPAWSNDGRLAYWYNGGGWPLHMHEIWIDGRPFVTKLSCEQEAPAWSPDSQYLIVTVCDSTTQGALYRVSLRDTTWVPLMQGCGYDRVRIYMSDGSLIDYNSPVEIFGDPAWSPDGSQIVYTRWDIRTDAHDLWVMHEDGSNQKQLTSGYYDYQPVWSPDGQSILFTRGVADANLFLISSDGSDIVQLTQYGGSNAAWMY